MASIRQPVVSVNLIPELSTVSLGQRRGLIVGTVPQNKNGIFGTGTTKFLQESQAVSFESKTKEELAELFGTGRLFHTIQQAIAGGNKAFPFDVLLVKNAESTDFSTLTFAGAATSKGTLSFSLFDDAQFGVKVDYVAGDTAGQMATKVYNAIIGKPNLPFTMALIPMGSVTFTWKDGFNTNSTPMHVKCFDAGLAPTVSHETVTQTTQPTVDLFDIVGDQRYTTVLWPDYYGDSVQNVLIPFLRDRLNVYNNILDGIGYTSKTSTLAALISETATYQSEGVVITGHRLIDGVFDASIGAADTQFPDGMVAFGAFAIDRTAVEGAILTDIISGAEGLADYTGGAALASLPYHNIPINNTTPNNPSWYFSLEEQRTLKENNISTLGANSAGNTNIIGDWVTLWKTDTAGNPNNVWTPLEHIRTSSIVREYFASSARTRFGKTRMTNGDTVIGRSMLNKALVEVWAETVFQELGDLALVTAGALALEEFQKRLNVVLSTRQGEVLINSEVEIVTHVGIFNFNLRVTTQYK